MGGSSAAGKAICSICYEDVEPLREDLQAIAVCGHVFHELCLQQWCEYCYKKKKISCPVCKQSCSLNDVHRLYFQSVGDAGDSLVSQDPSNRVKESEAIQRLKMKLEAQVSSLSSALEEQKTNVKDLSERFDRCKELADQETALKRAALREKTASHHLLQLKSEELVTVTSECSRLKERNTSLAKELASVKLVTDFNLEDEDVLKLASLGNVGNSRDTIDVLKKSLAIRNKCYKELMAKCNLLGRGEAHALKKIDKAKEKIKQLKTRYLELQTAFDKKCNEDLRASIKKVTCEEISPNNVGGKSNSCFVTKHSLNVPAEKLSTSVIDLDQSGSMNTDRVVLRGTETMEDPGANNTVSINDEKLCIFKDDAATDFSPTSLGLDTILRTDTKKVNKWSGSLRVAATSDAPKETLSIPSIIQTSKDAVHVLPASENDQVMGLNQSDSREGGHPSFQMKKVIPSSTSISQSGEQCFTGGFLGPDGTTRFLGRWCKRVNGEPISSSISAQGSSASSGDLIATGADGRGGTVKVLRSLEYPTDPPDAVLAKRRKQGGPKPSSMHRKSCLQLEHFFSKTDRKSTE